MAVTSAEVLKLLQRNTRRGHTVAELALDLQTSEHDVERACKTLLKEGKVTVGEGSGHLEYCALEEAEPKVEAEK
jgi:DNA-binding IclR family transcriptional regulator